MGPFTKWKTLVKIKMTPYAVYIGNRLIEVVNEEKQSSHFYKGEFKYIGENRAARLRRKLTKESQLETKSQIIFTKSREVQR